MAPTSMPCVPSQIRWLDRRFSSASKTRMLVTRSGICASRPSSFSTAST